MNIQNVRTRPASTRLFFRRALLVMGALVVALWACACGPEHSAATVQLIDYSNPGQVHEAQLTLDVFDDVDDMEATLNGVPADSQWNGGHGWGTNWMGIPGPDTDRAGFYWGLLPDIPVEEGFVIELKRGEESWRIEIDDGLEAVRCDLPSCEVFLESIMDQQLAAE
jgi:hypothetical protein